MRWLAISVVLSIVLTIVLNVVIRAVPDTADRARRKLEEAQQDDRRVRVFVPWKAMLVASIVLTIVANVLIRLL